MECLRRLQPVLPGGQGAVFDKALRGVHIDEAMSRLGWILVTGVHSVTDGEGRPRDWHIEDQVTGAGGQKSGVSIYARDGAAGHRELTETGEPVFVPWRRGRTMRRSGSGPPWLPGRHECLGLAPSPEAKGHDRGRIGLPPFQAAGQAQPSNRQTGQQVARTRTRSAVLATLVSEVADREGFQPRFPPVPPS
jgi:hypothetical protein